MTVRKNLISGHSTNCADITISDDAKDELITTAINAGSSTDFSDDSAGVLISAINAGNLSDSSDISISDYAADELIPTASDAGDSTDCAEDSAGRLIAAIDAVY